MGSGLYHKLLARGGESCAAGFSEAAEGAAEGDDEGLDGPHGEADGPAGFKGQRIAIHFAIKGMAHTHFRPLVELP